MAAVPFAPRNKILLEFHANFFQIEKQLNVHVYAPTMWDVNRRQKMQTVWPIYNFMSVNALIRRDISHSNKLCFVKKNCLALCVITLYGANIFTSPIKVINIAINLDS